MVRFKTAEITIISGTFKSDRGIFSKQDAYARIKYNGKVFKTRVIKGAGQHSVWNEKFVINRILPRQYFTFSALGKNIIADDFIGESEALDVPQLELGHFQQEIPIYDK